MTVRKEREERDGIRGSDEMGSHRVREGRLLQARDWLAGWLAERNDGFRKLEKRFMCVGEGELNG